ncbi:MAG: aminopeptidase P family protein [Flavobacteriales bacterium]
MRYQPLATDLYIRNRQKFCDRLPVGAMAIFHSNDFMPTNADGTMPFRQNNDLFYLSGIDQEESILLLFPDAFHEKFREVLFVKETNEEIRIWEGDKLSKDQASEFSGIKTVHWTEAFEKVLDSLMPQVKRVFLNSNEHLRAQKLVETRDDRFRKWMMERYPLHQYERSAPIMHELRSVKEKAEQERIREACAITHKGFYRVMEAAEAGIKEYELEAEMIREFTKNGSRGFPYEPIVASGGNACVLHYTENHDTIRDGELILMDFGAEYGNYASDMTRVIPVNGRFTERQRNVYNAVLRVQREAMKLLRPGTYLDDYHREVGKLMEEELIGLDLLDKQDLEKQDPEAPLYKRFFPHGTSHHIGLDVHDVGSPTQPVQEGMVFTVEPGIYIREEGIGVRLENDVVVTRDGVDDLMGDIPIEAESIEAVMNER